MRSRWAVGGMLRRTSVRRALAGGVAVSAAFVALAAVGMTGGIVVRDDDGCPRSVGSLGSVSWVDVLSIRGRTYERVDTLAPHGASVDRSQVGEQLGAIRCSLGDEVHDPGYELRDGEATFLGPDTAVHALADTDPSFRVVAIDDGQPAVYEHRPSTGASGADLLPFPAEDVVAVTFLSEIDGRTVLGQLTEPGTVHGFVDDLHAASVGDPPDLGEEPRVFLSLGFDDQPPVTMVAYPDHAITTAGLRLPDTVVEQIPPPAGR